MVPWIKMRTNLRDDPRVRLVAKRIGCNAVSVIGGLYVLWSLADQYSVDGRLIGYDADDLDKMFGKPGFAKALTADDVKWLEVGADTLVIPRFDEHNGESAKSRSQTAKRVQALRGRNAGVTDETLQKREQMKSKSKKEEEAAPPADEVGEDGKPITSDAVYRAYPKHVEPEPSRQSISEAVRYLRKRGTPTPWAWLMGRVKLYADARRELASHYPGADRFIPACHRWMRKKRYDEDPAEWAKQIPGTARISGENGHHHPKPDKRSAILQQLDARLTQ